MVMKRRSSVVAVGIISPCGHAAGGVVALRRLRAVPRPAGAVVGGVLMHGAPQGGGVRAAGGRGVRDGVRDGDRATRWSA
jgi:hypothetical protein